MSTDNIRHLKSSSKSAALSLQKTIDAIQQWRSQKKFRSEKIPESIWDMIFELLEHTPEPNILSKLGIDRYQFQNKLLDREISSRITDPSELQTTLDLKDFEFCEANTDYPLVSKPAKAFATNTSMVELYRPDGMLMKIHICTDSFEDLLRAFFEGSKSC